MNATFRDSVLGVSFVGRLILFQCNASSLKGYTNVLRHHVEERPNDTQQRGSRKL